MLIHHWWYPYTQGYDIGDGQRGAWSLGDGWGAGVFLLHAAVALDAGRGYGLVNTDRCGDGSSSPC